MEKTSTDLATGNKHILIVYASFSGSTKEIADSIKTGLMDDSITVDIIPAENRNMELSEYDFIILGTAINGNTPHPQIIEFINTNRDELNTKKIAAFVVCGTITSTKQKMRENAINYPDKVFKNLNVLRKEVFAGNMTSTGKKFEDFLAKFILGVKAGDHRDWNAIKNLTNEIKTLIS